MAIGSDVRTCGCGRPYELWVHVSVVVNLVHCIAKVVFFFTFQEEQDQERIVQYSSHIVVILMNV